MYWEYTFCLCYTWFPKKKSPAAGQGIQTFAIHFLKVDSLPTNKQADAEHKTFCVRPKHKQAASA